MNLENAIQEKRSRQGPNLATSLRRSFIQTLIHEQDLVEQVWFSMALPAYGMSDHQREGSDGRDDHTLKLGRRRPYAYRQLRALNQPAHGGLWGGHLLYEAGALARQRPVRDPATPDRCLLHFELGLDVDGDRLRSFSAAVVGE